MAVLKKFPLITIEKWQGQTATEADGQTPAFIWEEDAWINAAKQIKAVNPDAAVITWMDTMLVRACPVLSGRAYDLVCVISVCQCPL